MVIQTNQDLINLGFVPVPTPTIGNSLTYSLGRDRYLSVSHVGTSNVMVFIYDTERNEPTNIGNIITLYNCDYDGLLTKERIELFMKLRGKESYYKDKQSGNIFSSSQMLAIVDPNDHLDSFYKIGSFYTLKEAQESLK